MHRTALHLGCRALGICLKTHNGNGYTLFKKVPLKDSYNCLIIVHNNYFI